MRMVKRFSRSRWGRVCFLTLALSLASALLAGLGVGVVDQAKAQSPQILMSGTAIGGKPGQSPLSKVQFNHQKHEAAVNGNCDACHHTGSQEPCSSCHTSQGSPEGGNVQLSQAMHDAKAKASCVGCHYQETRKPECLGCHRNIAPGPKKDNCSVCHQDPKAAPAPAVPAQPDTVEIGSLSKRYGACTFDHAAHVEALKAAAKGDLAKAFHSGDAALCQGCHHHTPVGETPSKCGTCHGKAFQKEDPSRPGLMAAYHIQCNQCHKAMGVEPVAATDCTGCHAPKK
jgi:hypothetical protein